MKGVKIWFECSHELKVEFDILPQALLRLTQALTLMRPTPLLDWGLGPTEHSILSRAPLSLLLELPHPGWHLTSGVIQSTHLMLADLESSENITILPASVVNFISNLKFIIYLLHEHRHYILQCIYLLNLLMTEDLSLLKANLHIYLPFAVNKSKCVR